MVVAAVGGLWKSGLGDGIKLNNLVFVGVRTESEAEKEIMAQNGVTLIPPGPNVAQKLQEYVGCWRFTCLHPSGLRLY